MGYELWPEAPEQTIRYASSVAKVPIYVTENGIGTTDDEQRIDYVRRALRGVARLSSATHDVRGLFLLVADGQLSSGSSATGRSSVSSPSTARPSAAFPPSRIGSGRSRGRMLRTKKPQMNTDGPR
jgi:hypothetical protein